MLIPLDKAVQAQRALHDATGQGPEMFPVSAFVGMISDEVEQLRNLGRTDSDIVSLITTSSGIEITTDELREHYATPQQRHSAEH